MILGSHLERLPEDDREPFVDAVLEHGSHANYVRLNILARTSLDSSLEPPRAR